MRAAKVQASLRIRAVSPEPSLLAHTSSESRGTFRQKARSIAPLNGWACAVEICHDGMLEDTNSLDSAHLTLSKWNSNFQFLSRKKHRSLLLLVKFILSSLSGYLNTNYQNSAGLQQKLTRDMFVLPTKVSLRIKRISCPQEESLIPYLCVGLLAKTDLPSQMLRMI